MPKRLASLVFVALLFLWMFIVTFDAQPVMAEFANIVVPDDYLTIQEAINKANEGDTIYVRNGRYPENLVINKSLTLIGEKPPLSSTLWNYPRIFGTLRVNANNVKVKRLSFLPSGFPVVSVILFNVSGCEISQSRAWGDEPGPAIWLQNSSDNLIAYNLVAGVVWYGLIRLTQSYNNTIVGNFMSDADIGLYLESSSGNKIFHNNFIDNEKQIHLIDSVNNAWEDGYPSGGNFWSDYNGTDANHDGLGDSPYIIDVNNQDNYPLMDLYPYPDIGITTVNTSKTVFTEGYILKMNASVANYGLTSQTVNVSFRANSTEIETQIITLENISSVTLAFSWNTHGYASGNYTLSIFADASGDIDVLDNAFDVGVIITEILGDINGDGKVTLLDLVILALAYGSTPEMPPIYNPYNPNADLDNNEMVGLSDLVIMAKNYE